jgi:hypothetical protein
MPRGNCRLAPCGGFCCPVPPEPRLPLRLGRSWPRRWPSRGGLIRRLGMRGCGRCGPYHPLMTAEPCRAKGGRSARGGFSRAPAPQSPQWRLCCAANRRPCHVEAQPDGAGTPVESALSRPVRQDAPPGRAAGRSLEPRRQAQAAEGNARISPWSGRFLCGGRREIGSAAVLPGGPRKGGGGAKKRSRVTRLVTHEAIL